MKNKKDAKRTMTAILVAALCLGLSQTPALVQSAYAADTSTSGATEPGGGDEAKVKDDAGTEGEGNDEDDAGTEDEGGTGTEGEGDAGAEGEGDAGTEGEGDAGTEGEDGIFPANGDTENPEEPPIVETVENPVATIGDIQYKTWDEAFAAAQSGDTITLQKDIELTQESTIYSSKISVLTVDLNGHTVDGMREYRFLGVDSGTSSTDLTVCNGQIINCRAAQGGAIWAWDKLTLENVTFENCTAYDSYGGAIYVGSSVGRTILEATNCTFSGNEAAMDGGAISIFQANEASLTNCTFTGNTAVSQAAAVYIDHGSLNVNNCSFKENRVQTYGAGAILSYENKLTIENSEFVSNEAVMGGAISVTGNAYAGDLGQIDVKNTVFTQNSATYGGAIYGYYLSSSSFTEVTFTQNSASYGGAVYGYYLNPTLFTNVTFTENKATNGNGGAMYIWQADTTISGGKITDNTAAYGGAIMNPASALTLQDGTELHNNTATGQGDDIYANDYNGAQATITLIPTANAVLKADGKAITGWYVDGLNGEGTTNRWGAANEEDGVPFFEKVSIEETLTGNLALKAAHGRYFTVAYTDGVADSEIFADQAFEVEDGAETPKFDGTPAREGFTFKGWDKEIAETVTGDAVYTAVWEEIQTTPDPEEPTPPTSGGGYIPRPRPTTPPTTEITEPDVPLVETPEVTPEVPEVEVPDVQPPLDEAPAETEVEEEEVPLADVPKTGDAGSLPLAAALTASLAGIAGFVRKLRREK